MRAKRAFQRVVVGGAAEKKMTEKFLQNLQEAQKIIQVIDHMFYVTFPLIKDKKILLKIVTEAKNAITNCINAILQYEYLYKRIDLYKDPKANFRLFIQKCSPRYKITKNETDSILELFEVVEKHRQSTSEFVREDKIIILSENLKTEIINLERTKEFLNLSKSILKKTLEQLN